MVTAVSARIRDAVAALPLKAGMRVLEIGCGPGVAAREIVRLWPDVHVLGIDRSASAIRLAVAGALALPRIRAALVRGGPLYVDGGNPLRQLALDRT